MRASPPHRSEARERRARRSRPDRWRRWLRRGIPSLLGTIWATLPFRWVSVAALGMLLKGEDLRPRYTIECTLGQPGQRRAVRSAAAAAMGASTIAARLSAHSMRKGGQGEAGPVIAAEAVATPKISTGT